MTPVWLSKLLSMEKKNKPDIGTTYFCVDCDLMMWELICFNCERDTVPGDEVEDKRRYEIQMLNNPFRGFPNKEETI